MRRTTTANMTPTEAQLSKSGIGAPKPRGGGPNAEEQNQPGGLDTSAPKMLADWMSTTRSMGDGLEKSDGWHPLTIDCSAAQCNNDAALCGLRVACMRFSAVTLI